MSPAERLLLARLLAVYGVAPLAGLATYCLLRWAQYPWTDP